MKITTCSLATVAAAAFLVAGVHAVEVVEEDVLLSKRADSGLRRRFVDEQGNYNISFYHINDVHAHLDEFRSSGTDCTDPKAGCFGGYTRVKTVLDRERPGKRDSLLLNVGDEFQGTLFYSYYGGEKIAETLNQMGFDGMTLGNHEFDAGPDKLASFLSNLTFPIISANIHSNNSVLNATIKPFHIYPQHSLAIIGVTTEDTPSISSPGAGTTFSNAIEAVQRTIDLIKATTNITRIAAITHIGYEEDIKLAEQTRGLQLIMGGHSHTPLGDFVGAAGKYPTVKTNKEGDEVFIVTAYRWGEYLGYIDVTYSPTGKILAYHGAPIHLTNATAQDPKLQAQIKEWRGPFEAFAAEEVGTSSVELENGCRARECLMGQVMADAMLGYRLNQSTTADFALINSGGVRAAIDIGPITRGEVLTAFPFGNAIVEIELSGTEVWKTLEGVMSKVNVYNNKAVTSTIQVSRGVEVLSAAAGNGNATKLVGVNVGGKALVMDETYHVVTLDFLAGGGDNIFQKQSAFAILDTQDEVLTGYIEANSPISNTLQARIFASNGTATSGNGTTPVGGGAAVPSSTEKPSAGNLALEKGTVGWAMAGVVAVMVVEWL